MTGTADPLDAAALAEEALIEKVARAIYEADRSHLIHGEAFIERHGTIVWERRSRSFQDYYRDQARAAIEATGILAERQARLEAERQLAEADAVIAVARPGGLIRGISDEQRSNHTKWRNAALDRHASRSRPSDDRRETP